jgi:hypothetical protein
MTPLHRLVGALFRRQRIRISFDIDDTLVCHPNAAAADNGLLPGFLHRRLGEPLRRGTCALIRELRRRKCSIWIYTSSGRTPQQIRSWLWTHGIRIDGVVNCERHHQELAGHRLSCLPSKYPPAFGIDLHVDDSLGVKMEGDTHGFRVVLVRPDDKLWTQQVLDAVTHVQKLHEQRSPKRQLHLAPSLPLIR